MRLSIKYYLITFTFLGATIYFLQKLQISLPKIINNYMNDFLVVPIVLSISLLAIRKIKTDEKYTLSIGIILYTSLIYSLLFEFLLPMYFQRYTSDFIDIILYFIGGFTFELIQKNKKT